MDESYCPKRVAPFDYPPTYVLETSMYYYPLLFIQVENSKHCALFKEIFYLMLFSRCYTQSEGTSGTSVPVPVCPMALQPSCLYLLAQAQVSPVTVASASLWKTGPTNLKY